jgi:membrane fusion protein (multidrug efflux system)
MTTQAPPRGIPGALLRLALGAAALGAALIWLSGGCGERIEPGSAPRPPLPETAPAAPVESVTGRAVERASGSVASARQTTVSAKILARIEAIAVRAGDVVQAGDELIRLDARALEAQARELDEQLRSARARLDLARRERERIEKLSAADVASEDELDRARSAFDVAEADVRAAEQRLADAEVARSYAVIHSPVTGRVVDRLAEPGDMAAPGVALLRIYDPSALRLEVPVRESLAVRLAVGQSLRVDLDALGESVEGSIEEIVPFAEPGARTLLVKVRLPDDPRLFAGMFGRVELPAGEVERLLIPAAAVTRIGQLEFATALDAGGRRERRLITTGRPADGGRVEVLSGLAAGERVVVDDAAAGDQR